MEKGKTYTVRCDPGVYTCDYVGESIAVLVYKNPNSQYTHEITAVRRRWHLFTEMKPKIKVDTWLNVYPDGLINGHQTKEHADRRSSPDRIACYHLVTEIDAE